MSKPIALGIRYLPKALLAQQKILRYLRQAPYPSLRLSFEDAFGDLAQVRPDYVRALEERV